MDRPDRLGIAAPVKGQRQIDRAARINRPHRARIGPGILERGGQCGLGPAVERDMVKCGLQYGFLQVGHRAPPLVVLLDI